MEYKTIICTDQPTLHKRVNEHIQEGWTPLGGLSITEDQDFMRCGQDMIREPKAIYPAGGFVQKDSPQQTPSEAWPESAPPPTPARLERPATLSR